MHSLTSVTSEKDSFPKQLPVVRKSWHIFLTKTDQETGKHGYLTHKYEMCYANYVVSSTTEYRRNIAVQMIDVIGHSLNFTR